MNKTNIAWADMVWNPVTGCTQISEGCQNCYAKRMAETRLRGRCGYDQDEPFKLTFHWEKLSEPSKVKKPQNIFVCSMGDLFHEDIKWSQINDVMNVISQAHQHKYMILTKRSHTLLRYWTAIKKIPDNLWLGVTAENQQRADERIPDLIATGHENLFVSLEPLLEAVNITPYLNKIKWVIIGAESGTGKRQCRIEWVYNLIYKCKVKEVPVFYKQGLGDTGEWVKEPEIWGEKWLQFPEGLKLDDKVEVKRVHPTAV